jgi:aspartyl-tRNA(Asn)/glutamyl-tRNA(Gln) amidotransferase subunit B
MPYETVVGLEVHAELQTQSKMFCACPVVDSTASLPNVAVCPVCAGMPGVLPVVNRQAVEYALRVALALDCEIQPTSLFARKNYFYPDLPKGYQISQYEYPLALNGRLRIYPSSGERDIRIRRVHLEEDTGKLTHVNRDGESYSLVDLNRAGVALLEIVSEPDLRSVEEVRAYAEGLRALLRYLGVNSGDMQKGVIRFEANVSVRPLGSQELGTRVEIKNLNSFRALERAVAYQVSQQVAALQRGERVSQQTLGWDDLNEVTLAQRSKEEAHDYRYFPEPDLPPLVVDAGWIERVRAGLPELPAALIRRLQTAYGLPPAYADLLAEDPAAAAYFEQAAQTAPELPPQTIANWILGELFAWLNASGESLRGLKVSPASLAELLRALSAGQINQPTAKSVLAEMLRSGRPAEEIIAAGDLGQLSDPTAIAGLVEAVLAEFPRELEAYRAGKTGLANWFFGQVMRRAEGKANPQQVREALAQRLGE